MKKIFSWSFLLLAFWALAACSPETTTNSSESGESNEGAEVASEVSEPIEVAGNFPAASFPEALDERNVDHFKGAEDPVLTVIEYGDFQ